MILGLHELGLGAAGCVFLKKDIESWYSKYESKRITSITEISVTVGNNEANYEGNANRITGRRILAKS